LLTSGYILTSRYGTMGVVAAHYIIIGSIPAVVTVYRTIKRDFVKLAWQLAIVYATSFAVIAGVSLGLSLSPLSKTAVSGLLVPACWYMYYRAFADGIGRRTISTLLAFRSTGPVEVGAESGSGSG